MATAGCLIMDVKGGLTMRLVGPVPRYATKELVFMEILPLRTENQVLTGSEFVDYLNRLQRIAGRSRRDRPDSPLGVPAGESAVSPGNEGAIQEGSLPAQGPLESPSPEGTSTPPSQPANPPPSVRPSAASGSGTTPAKGSAPASQVPGTMRPARKPSGGGVPEPQSSGG
jgi:hypothetical protein